jgi:hypothetical protein
MLAPVINGEMEDCFADGIGRNFFTNEKHKNSELIFYTIEANFETTKCTTHTAKLKI